MRAAQYAESVRLVNRKFVLAGRRSVWPEEWLIRSWGRGWCFFVAFAPLAMLHFDPALVICPELEEELV
jgi:hypothetical protein